MCGPIPNDGSPDAKVMLICPSCGHHCTAAHLDADDDYCFCDLDFCAL